LRLDPALPARQIDAIRVALRDSTQIRLDWRRPGAVLAEACGVGIIDDGLQRKPEPPEDRSACGGAWWRFWMGCGATHLWPGQAAMKSGHRFSA